MFCMQTQYLSNSVMLDIHKCVMCILSLFWCIHAISGLAFLVVFGFIFVIQFLCMLVHRLETLSHFVSRLPYRCNATYNKSWSFDNDVDPEMIQALREVSQAEREGRRRLKEKQRQKKLKNSKLQQIVETETTPLLVKSTATWYSTSRIFT